MRANIIGGIGLIIIAIFAISWIRDITNAKPLFMGETITVKGKVISNEIVYRARRMAYRIDYEYNIEGEIYKDHYFGKAQMYHLKKGDSVTLSVSLRWPAKNKLISFQRSIPENKPPFVIKYQP